MNLIFSGFFGSNVGDTAVTRGSAEMISKVLPDEPIVVLASPFKQGQAARWRSMANRVPKLALGVWDTKLQCLNCAKPPSLAFVDQLLDSSLIIERLAESIGLFKASRFFYGGGEHLFSYGNDHDDWNLLCRILPSLLANKLGLQTVCLPSTFGPFHTDFSREIAARFFAAQKLILARDAFSLTAVPSPHKPILALDPGFYVPTGARTRRPSRKGPYSIGIVMRQEEVGLRVGVLGSRKVFERQRENGDESLRSYRAAWTAIRRLRTKGHTVKILVQCDADRPLALRLYRPYQHDDQVELVQPSGLANYIRDLSRCDGIITSRFHSAVFALMTGAVPLGLYFEEHGHKIPGLFKMFDMSELCFSLVNREVGARVDGLIGAIRKRAGKAPSWTETLHDLRMTSLGALSSSILPAAVGPK